MRFRIHARDFPHPISSIEGAEDPHNSGAAIGRHYRHYVHVAAQKLCACSKHAIGLPNAGWGLPHEIANGRVKEQPSAQRAEKLPAAAVTLQDFTFSDWEGCLPALKLLHGLRQGELERQGLDGTSHDVSNRESPQDRIFCYRGRELSIGLAGEQRLLQVFLQRSKRV